jgi:hypothetical protein
MPFNVSAMDLSGVTTGTGAVHINQGFNVWSMQTTFSAGVSAGTVVMEASIDGLNFGVLSSRTFAASTTFIDMATTSAKYLRVRISVSISGGTVSLGIAATGPLPNDAS